MGEVIRDTDQGYGYRTMSVSEACTTHLKGQGHDFRIG
jgi:hypothetical protein